MSHIDIIKAELDGDPIPLNYPASDQGAADVFNSETTGRTRNRVSMTGDEVFAAIENKAAWDAAGPDNRNEFLILCDRLSIDPFERANVDVVRSIFGGSSQTVTNLAALRVEIVSRGVELEIGKVKPGHVAEARRLP